MCEDGRNGQLGTGDSENRSIPTKSLLPNLLLISQISCGGYHTAFLTKSGEVCVCGIGDKEVQLIPTRSESQMFKK